MTQRTNTATPALGRAAGAAWLAVPLLAVAAPPLPTPEELARLSIEELAQVEISSVSRRPETLQEAAAAIFVISRDDIRRSGATSLPEILRLAPNLQVARLDASRYAITARGFNGTAANKLQVLIDGRSVYTPLFSGVFWDAQDVFPEDIERVEVISGPGGTLWGSNAVNGVINVVTRPAAARLGTLAVAGAGSAGHAAGIRHGVRLGDDASLRLYARRRRHDDTFAAGGGEAGDAWHKNQAGFRFDWGRSGNALTLQGDLYDGALGQGRNPDAGLGGGNLLGRWRRTLANGSEIEVQAYYDRTRRHIPGTFSEVLETWDLHLQQRWQRGAHDIVWGGGYRLLQDDVGNSAVLAFLPARRDLKLANLFLQDSIALNPRLQLTLGGQLEHNSYSGLEFQPNARLAWKLHPNATLWAALSRSVRTPSRIDREFFVPGPPAPPALLAGGPAFESERLIAYQLGYRVQPAAHLSWSMTLFHHDYDRLRSLESSPGGGPPFVIANKMKGRVDGLETWGSYQVNADWRLAAGYTYLRKRLAFAADSRDTSLARAGNDPRYQFFLRSAHNLRPGLELDLALRAIGSLPEPAVPAYVAVDGRLGWRLAPAVELSLTATNLFDRRHREFATTAGTGELGRNFQVQLRWQF